MLAEELQLAGLALGEPGSCRRALTFWAVPVAAGVIGDSRVGAILAAHDMPAECRRAATLDRRHHLELAEADMAGVSLPPRRSVAAEDMRDLESGTESLRRSEAKIGEQVQGFLNCHSTHPCDDCSS